MSGAALLFGNADVLGKCLSYRELECEQVSYSVLKFRTSKCLFRRRVALYLSLHYLYQHLKMAGHSGIAFPGDETQIFDNVVFALNKNGRL